MDAVQIVGVVLCACICIGVLCIIIHKILTSPSDEVLNNVVQWLVGAVTDAEKDFGGGTGALKLRQVYDLFLIRFPKIAHLISFEMFSVLVDEALEIMREMLKNNPKVKAYVDGEGAKNGSELQNQPCK